MHGHGIVKHRGVFAYCVVVSLIHCFDGCCLGYVKTEGDTEGSRPVVYECTNAEEYGRCPTETLSILGHTACS